MAREIILRQLAFTGPQKVTATLNFSDGFNFVWGASNTGKSFTLKSLDFMLGGSTPLPDIKQREGYDTVWLSLTLGKAGDVTLSRSLQGGAFQLHQGHVTAQSEEHPPSILKAKHDPSTDDNLSALLLNELNLRGKQIATNAFGQKRPISFRDLDILFLVDETSIQIERSPIEAGQRDDRTSERSVFRLLLTGIDDSSVVTVDDPKKFNAARTVRLEVIDDLIAKIDTTLQSEYPDTADLENQLERLQSPVDAENLKFSRLQTSISNLLFEKQELSSLIPKTGTRLDDVNLHIERFENLRDVYASDIQRLEALEEAGFLLGLSSERPCPLCGAEPEAQSHTHDHENIAAVREAAIVEIAKIRRQSDDLALALNDLETERDNLESQLPELSERLQILEQKIVDLTPQASQSKATLTEIIEARDHANRGISLLHQKNELAERRANYGAAKAASKADRPVYTIPHAMSHEFAQTVSHVLKRWGFPGNCAVSFEDNTYDLKIDGNPRLANGKGVRAVTHSAFKVALLLHCQKHNLPHPGILVLDTPLLTYRDPLRNPKHGELTEDERELAQTSLKDRFFSHLASLNGQAQFIILENVDPPSGVDEEQVHIEAFSGNTGGRSGLFPSANVDDDGTENALPTF